jgi:hypothetical protein
MRSFALFFAAALLALFLLASCATLFPGRHRPPSRSNAHACDYCHSSERPDSGRDLLLPAEEKSNLCLLCHEPGNRHYPLHHPFGFTPKHFLKSPSGKMMRRIRRTEEEEAVLLPMVPRRRITCSTCRNPHQEGVIRTVAAQKGAGARGKLRMPKDKLCSGCHSTH